MLKYNHLWGVNINYGTQQLILFLNVKDLQLYPLGENICIFLLLNAILNRFGATEVVPYSLKPAG